MPKPTTTRPPTPAQIRAAMRVLGGLGGRVKSPAKTAAARANAKKRWDAVRAAKTEAAS